MHLKTVFICSTRTQLQGFQISIYYMKTCLNGLVRMRISRCSDAAADIAQCGPQHSHQHHHHKQHYKQNRQPGRVGQLCDVATRPQLARQHKRAVRGIVGNPIRNDVPGWESGPLHVHVTRAVCRQEGQIVPLSHRSRRGAKLDCIKAWEQVNEKSRAQFDDEMCHLECLSATHSQRSRR